MPLSVVIVSYRVPELLLACLTSLVPQLLDGDEVVVVDNAGDDGTASLVRSAFPSVRLVSPGVNSGFGAGCNLGAAGAAGDLILLLNPDTVVHPGALAALRDVARRRPEAELWGGRTVSVNGALDPRSCWGLPTLWSRTCFALGLSALFRGSAVFDPESLGSWARDTEREVGMVTGCLLLITRSLWDRLGGFDERFFMYGEDTDLNLRARRLGARPRVTPTAVVTHVVGASSGRVDKRVLLLRGQVTLARTHRRRAASAYEVGALRLGVLLRATPGLLRSHSVVDGESSTSVKTSWTGAWRRRAEWLRGY